MCDKFVNWAKMVQNENGGKSVNENANEDEKENTNTNDFEEHLSIKKGIK